MKKLLKLLAERGIKFDHIDRRIMCLPHILNICSKHVMEEYADADFAAVSDAWVNALGNVVNKDKYIEALQHDLIVLGHDIVRIIRSSSLHHEGFGNTIVTGNQMSWFTNEEGEPIQLPILELLHDIKTRWDSIYYTINQLRTLRQVFYMYAVCCPFLILTPRLSMFPSKLQQTRTSLIGSCMRWTGKLLKIWRLFLRYVIHTVRLVLTAFRSHIRLSNQCHTKRYQYSHALYQPSKL